MPTEKIRLRIGNLGRAVLITGQAYQDPKDALNEFVSNAADEYREAGQRGERIRVVLRRRGRYPVIAIDDSGRGMDGNRLRLLARSLFESNKVDDPRTLGEKGIGLLAFQQLGGRCEIVSRTAASEASRMLRLDRGKANAQLSAAPRHRARTEPGTTVYLSDLDPDVLRVLTQRKVVDYLRRRREAALADGEYEIEVIEGSHGELVTAEEPDGVKLKIPAQPTLWGRIEFHIYVSPRPDRRRRVAVVGRAGTTIVDDLSEIEEFDGPPWSSDQVSGRVVFESLQQSAGRRAVLRDRDAFPIFVDAVRSIEPAVIRTLEQVAKEVDEATADRLADTVRRIFGRVLKELADLDNPMRTATGSEEGQGALLVDEQERPSADRGQTPTESQEQDLKQAPGLRDLMPPAEDPESAQPPPPQARPGGRGSRGLPTLLPDPSPDGVRSRFDPEQGVVYYNENHPDYLLVKESEQALVDYLSTLVAKEYVVYNNARAQPNDLAEEMVRMLVRVRRHLPKRS
ncbi:MAG: ATP-binding protein [Actinomycetota bacterium]